MSRRPAFSLIELAIVVGLVAMLLTLAWPSLEGTLATERLQASGRQVETLVRDARRLALQHGVDYRIEADRAAGALRARPDPAMESEPLPPGVPAPAQMAADGAESAESVEFALPDGVRFDDAESGEKVIEGDGLGPDADLAEPGEQRIGQPTELPSGDADSLKGRWRLVGRIYADGSADPAVLTLCGRAGACVECRIDPLTALVRIRDVRPENSRMESAGSEQRQVPIQSEAQGSIR